MASPVSNQTLNSADKPLLRALRGETGAPPSLWLMRQAGRYLPEYRELRKQAGSFLELCYNPALAAEVTLQPITRFHMDAAILFSDILVIPDALGVDLSFVEGEGPRLTPLKNLRDIEALRPDRIADHLAPVYETVERVAAGLPEGAALIGFAGAPWTVATYMIEGGTSRDFTATRSWALRDPESFQRLIDILVAATVEYLIDQLRHGAEAIQIFDSWAGVLSESEFRRWSLAPMKAIVEGVRAACPEAPIIGFPRGAGAMMRDYVLETGVDGISIDSATPVAWAAQTLQPHCAVQGNLDPLCLLYGGSRMSDEITAILDALAGGPFVFNLGHGIVPATPPEHVAELVETVRGWRP
jgi:uroporphyrinogen decarboxylase